MNLKEHDRSVVDAASEVLPNVAGVKTRRRSREDKGFTKASVKLMRCPSDKSERFFWDPSCRGFGLRTLRSGQRTWIYQYRDQHKRTRRIALGDATAVSPEAAREAARRHAGAVAQGGNPSVERAARGTAVTVVVAIEAYLTHAESRLRASSLRETRRHLCQHASPLHHEPMETVHRRSINELLERLAKTSGPIAANQVRAALSTLWAYAMRRGLIDVDANPVAYSICQPKKARDRVLTPDELRAVWKAAEPDTPYHRIIRLVILTGSRRRNIGMLRWSNVLEDRILIAGEEMKGHDPHEIPLTAGIRRLLGDPDTGYIFGPGGFLQWGTCKAAFDKRLVELGTPVKAWVLHDLRRTFSTRLHDGGQVQPIVVEALLAHKQQGVAGIYNRASFFELKRAALEWWYAQVTEAA
jgi:integrase